MRKLLLSMLFLPAISFAGTHAQEGSPFVAGQCLQAGSGDTITTTGSACGGTGGSGIVSPGTFTWVNNFGIALSTAVVSSTFTLSGEMVAGGSPGNSGQVLVSNGAGAAPTFVDPIVSQSTFSLLNAAVRVTDYNGVILGTSTNNPFYTYTSNPSTAPITIIGNGPGGVTQTLSGRITPQTVGTIKNATDTVSVFVSTYSNVTFQIAPGTSTGITVNFEASVDSGTNWVPITCNRISTYNTETSFVLTTSTNIWTASIVGLSNFRVRSSAWSTGIATVTIQVTGDPVSQSISVGQPTAASLQASVSINGSSNTVQATVINIPTTTISGAVTVNTHAVTESGTWVVTATQTIPSNLQVSAFINGSSNTVQATLLNVATVTISGTTSVNATSVNIATVTFNGSTATVQGIAQTTSLPAAVSAGAVSPAFSDKFGRFMVTGIPRDQIKQATATLTSTTETVLISSGAASVFNDLCGCILANTSATAVRIDLRGQGNGGTINNAFYLPAGDTRGFWPGCQNPFVQLSSASNWTVQLSGSVTDVRVTCQYIPLK